MSHQTRHLEARSVTVGYGNRVVLQDLDLAVSPGRFTVIVGPNACGKSTLLQTLARMLRPRGGTVLLDGDPIGSWGSKEVARRVGLLPQAPTAPDGIVVEDLVARGRYPHQGLLRQWSPQDQQAVDDALERTGVAELRERAVSELSGGQRQRVWIALALAQQTDILLLDEPTTFLDVSHQVEVLDLCRGLQVDGITVVAVLHDLNLAFRYGDEVVMMRDGRISAIGRPSDVVTAERIEQIFDLPCRVIEDPESHTPLVIPRWAT